jgi:hypothetical protein
LRWTVPALGSGCRRPQAASLIGPEQFSRET